MSCPRCGLSILLRAPYLTLERCPRCLAKARISVPMFISEGPRDQDRPRGPDAGPGPPGPTGPHSETSLEGLVIRTERRPEAWILSLHGELDLASAPALQHQLEAGQRMGIARTVVDLSGLEFLDSTGLQVLLYADRRLQENGQTLVLRRGPRAIQRLFELTHTSALFRFED